MNGADLRSLGDSGLRVSALGVGCNAFGTRIDQKAVDAIVDTALNRGVRFFDTADSYGRGQSELMLGRALGSRRDEAVVATKFGMDTAGLDGPDFGARASRRYLRAAVEGSLRRLGTDYLDLYQLHRPDGVTPIEETLVALDDLVREGKVLHVGCSNFAAWEVTHAHHVAEGLGVRGFVSAQNEYSLYNRTAEDELLPACRQAGVGVLPYFPLAYGLLTGKYARDTEAPAGSRLSGPDQRRRLAAADFDRVDALADYAARRDLDLLTVAISGLAAQPGVGSVICGVSRVEQIDTNLAAAGWEPTEADLDELTSVNHDPLPGMSARTFAL